MKLCVRSYFIFLQGLLTLCATRSLAHPEAFETKIPFENERGRIHIPAVFSAALKDSAPLLTEKTKRALQLVTDRTQIPLRDDFYLYFDAQPDNHNGLTTVIPNNRIIVQTEPPFVTESIGLSRDYLTETILHELGHMTPLQQRRGVFAFFDYVVGTTSRPVGLWPRWMHEGLAVWTEAALGGRPESGYIDFELRKYAESYARTGRHPMTNSDLDGTPRQNRVEPGDLPYHFGYLLLQQWSDEQRRRNPMVPLVNDASGGLGSSFRTAFRSEGPALDGLFARAQKNWAATPLVDVEKTKESSKVILGQADTVTGPFSNDQALTWIEGPRRGDDRRLKARLPDGALLTTNFHHHYEAPLTAFLTSEHDWLLLVRRPDPGQPYAPSIRSVSLYSPAGKKICDYPTPPRLREIDLQGDTLAWTRNPEGGPMVAESARIGARCTLSPALELARGREAFERLSMPRLSADGKLFHYSRSEGTDSYREFLRLPEGEVRTNAPLTEPYPVAPAMCGDRDALACYVAHKLSREYWGPILITRTRAGWSSREVFLRTGSSRSAAVPGSPTWIALKEHFWESDRVTLVPVANFTEHPSPLEFTAQATAPERPSTVAGPLSLKPYSPWPSIWPNFWYPSLASEAGGFQVMGQTFYQDLTDTWAGFSSLGYDSLVQRPFFITNLQRQHLENMGPLATLGVSLNYAPVYNYYAFGGQSHTQDRWGGSAYGVLGYWLPREWMLTFTPQLQYLGAARAAGIGKFNAIIGTAEFRLHSAHGLAPLTMIKTIDLRDTGLYFSQQTGIYQELYSTQSINFSAPLGRTALQATLQYAETSVKNGSVIYFAWGGLPQLATDVTGYLSRGFPTLIGPAQAILRPAVEWQFNLARPDASFSWDRARLQSIEGRLIVESVSFSQFPLQAGVDPRFQVGQQYFTSAGAMLDFWSSALHYVNFVASGGYFHGFGQYGENNYSVVMRGWFDL